MALSLLSAFALAALVLLSDAPPSRDTAEALRTRGLELGFNLDYDEAIATFREAIAAEPDNLTGYRLLATSLWTRALLQRGAVSADDLVGDAGSALLSRPPDLDLQKAISDLERRAEALDSAPRRRGSPADAEAAYQIGAANRFLSSYAATLGGDQWRSISTGRRAFREHQHVLTLDRRQDALLTVGLYRFWVSTLPVWSRLVARVAGLAADREQGLRLVEEAAAAAGPAQATARFSLIVIYNKVARHDAALGVIGELRRQFPRNRLLWLEAGTAALGAGRPADAREALARGLQMLETEKRPLAFGERARWRYYYGVSLARMNQIEYANRELRTALEGEALDWVRGRTHLELGKLAERAGDPTRAREELRQAVQLCDAGDDPVYVTDSRALLRRK